MKTLVPSLIFIAAGAAAWAATPSAATTPKPTPHKLCQNYADAQLRATDIGTVSGTTVTSSYDEKTGFCTVEISNKTPGHIFSGRMMTNTLDSSPTTVRIQTFAQPVAIRYVAPPQRLLCSKVTSNKNGTLTCTPYTPDPDARPFFPLFPEWDF
jgi:hypothetical protein